MDMETGQRQQPVIFQPPGETNKIHHRAGVDHLPLLRQLHLQKQQHAPKKLQMPKQTRVKMPLPRHEIWLLLFKTIKPSPAIEASSSPPKNMDGRQSGRGDRTAVMELNAAKAEAARLAAENERLKSQMEKDKERKRKEKETAPEPPPPPKRQGKSAAISRKRQVVLCPCLPLSAALVSCLILKMYLRAGGTACRSGPTDCRDWI